MRSKVPLLAGIVAAGSLALFAATQVWVVLELAPGAAVLDRLEATGQDLNASLSPIALAALASALALTIAGRWLRRILGGLVAALGLGLVGLTFGALVSPGRAAAGALGEATGLSGEAQGELVRAVALGPAIWIGFAAGVALVVFGALVLLLSGRWRTAGRKYRTTESASRAAPAEAESARATAERDPDPADEHDRISEWDELSGGVDPTDDDR